MTSGAPGGPRSISTEGGSMSKLKLNITMSIDGFVAGPGQSQEHPLGVGGEELHDWLVPLKAFRESHGEEGGEVNASTPFAEDILGGAGATIMGRNMFGGGPGPWDESWKGWWGDDPPYHHPVFVVTSHPREPLEMEGGTTFHFVTDGIESALGQARQAAGDRDVAIAGGASAVQQYLGAGPPAELSPPVVPVVLGAGERLLENVGDPTLEPIKVVAAPDVTHVKYPGARQARRATPQPRRGRPTRRTSSAAACARHAPVPRNDALRGRLHRLDVAAHVGGRLAVGVAERLLHVAQELLDARRERIVDRAQELEGGREADVGDRRAVAADELVVAQEELLERGERVGERVGRVPDRPGLEVVARFRRADLAGVLR